MVHADDETQDRHAAALRRLYVALQRAQHALREADDALHVALRTAHPSERRPAGSPARLSRTGVWDALIEAELKNGARAPNAPWFPHRLEAHYDCLHKVAADNFRLCIHVAKLLRTSESDRQPPGRHAHLTVLARLRPKTSKPSPHARAGTDAARPPVGQDDGHREILALDALHPALHSRVMAATAHAPIRIVERRRGDTGEEYEVFAVADDQFVHMSLALHPDGSVAETTHTALRAQMEVVAAGADHATIRIPDDVIAVPLEIASAIRERETAE